MAPFRERLKRMFHPNKTAASSEALVLPPMTVSSPIIEDKYNFHYHDSNPTMLNILPYELLLHITSFLPLSSIASLSLINRFMMYCMRTPDPWTKFQFPEYLHDRCEFLLLLDRDYPHHLLCHECGKFHPRDSSEKDGSRVSKGFTCRKWMDKNSISSLVLNPRRYDWQEVQTTMRAFRFGPNYGDSHALNCDFRPVISNAGWWPSPNSTYLGGSKGGWASKALALSVDDRLLLREQFFWAFPRHVRNWHPAWLPRPGDIRSCRHAPRNMIIDGVGDAMRNAAKPSRCLPQASTGKTYRCVICPTEFTIDVVPLPRRKGLFVLVFTRYLDLGEYTANTVVQEFL
ncbi:uncharacterized protein BDR25DRAFT_381015 [Lindgomyces ingoldianus]|uniref:Uncharacterized protein n=1 Tax=Lindgomyces ingoldianus TaxID=673940 RepID=A0ACB6QC07_9PLEO|nr:uncharacterized protein BDR25DRAFT_381015 [Lindgomyces ingoldianus]KAF2464446.1 hypothetical protein BDR25DRAFT_381015 [Lindgomyces ingoldianus]